MTHSLGVLSMHGVAELQESLKLVVSGERDDLQHGAKLTKDLWKILLIPPRTVRKDMIIKTSIIITIITLMISAVLTCWRTSRVTG